MVDAATRPASLHATLATGAPHMTIDPKAVEAAARAMIDISLASPNDWPRFTVFARASLAAALPILKAGIRAKAMESAAKSADLLKSNMDHEIAHGKHVGEWGAGYQQACDDISSAIRGDPSDRVGNGEGEE